MNQHRRNFIKTTTLATAAGILWSDLLFSAAEVNRTVRVVVWDERQPRQKQAYDNFLGNQIADHLREQPGLSVVSTALDDPDQGLSDSILDNCDVLIWWGHARQREVLPETGVKIVERISAGTLSLIALHSAHWSTPFTEAMNELTRRRTTQAHKSDQEHPEITFLTTPTPFKAPKYDSRITPFTVVRKFPQGGEKLEVYLPNCAFPAYRGDGKPSTVFVKMPRHPIVKGVPAKFEVSQTEMYDEPFHVPEPDEVIMEERWAGGEWFRSGAIWKLGKGKVFYFRPGHETFPVYKEKWPLQILTNAVRWMGA